MCRTVEGIRSLCKRIHAPSERASALRDEMWAIEKEAIRSGYSPDLMSSLGGTLTELATLSETRVVSGVYTRVPETVLALLLFGSALSLGMVGYSASLRERRSASSPRSCSSWPWARS